MSGGSSPKGRARSGKTADPSGEAGGEDRPGPQGPGLSTGAGSWQRDASVRGPDDLAGVNARHLLADTVGRDLLAQIARDFLDLVGSAAGICEKSGDCVVGVFGSGWCEFLNAVSAGQSGAVGGKQPAECGKGGCLEVCGREATKACVETAEPADIECAGGMRVYAVPIWAEGEIVGAVSFGYGDVPDGLDELRQIAERYEVNVDLLREKAQACEPRPEVMTDVAKKQVVTWAKLIGGIVERKRAAEALREREEFSSSLLKSSPNPILVINPDTSVRYVNPALETLTGFSSAEVVGSKPPYPWWTEGTLGQTDNHFRKALRNGADRVEELFQKKSGERLWVEITSIPVIRHGQLRYYLANWVDVTQRKQAEEAVQRSREQLRALAGHLQDVREEERTRLARKIHDDVGHALASLKMDLSRLEKGVGSSRAAPGAGLRKRMKAMSEVLDGAMESVRQTAGELRPGILDDVGLAAALEWEAKQFQTRTGIKCAFAGSVEKGRLDGEQSTALYRICQELLTNVVLHSGGDGVEVSLREHAGNLLLEVRDNGRGISAGNASSSASLGIVGMRERALLLGGVLSISGVRGEGTTATVRIPLSRGQAPGRRGGENTHS